MTDTNDQEDALTAGQEEAQRLLDDPARFDARLWEFIGAVRDGTAVPGPDMFSIACCVTGMWMEMTARLYMRVRDLTEAEAEALVATLIEDQRSLTGSLAAPPADSRR